MAVMFIFKVLNKLYRYQSENLEYQTCIILKSFIEIKIIDFITSAGFVLFTLWSGVEFHNTTQCALLLLPTQSNLSQQFSFERKTTVNLPFLYKSKAH